MVELAPFAVALNATGGATLWVAPANEAVISWNTYAASGTLRFRLLGDDGSASNWYDYARWSPSARRSFNAGGARDGIRISVDVVHAQRPFHGIELHADGVDFTLLAISTPVAQRESLPYAAQAMILDVPARSQYVVEDERGWCSPSSLSMLNAFFGIDVDIATTAANVYDDAYRGTGNWAFNAAYSGTLGLRAVVAYLANLDHAARLIERGIPLALSYAWSAGELPGAPLEQSQGHLAVLRGFTANGDCVMNDPATPNVRIVYPRRAFETVWQRSGGIAYVAAPAGKEYFDILAAP